MEDAYLVIDSSSGSVRAYVTTPAGERLATRSRAIRNVKDPAYPDALAFDPEVLRHDLFAVCAEAVAAAGDVRVIAVSATSQREGVVLLDEEDRPVGGYPNIDNRGQTWEDSISEHHAVYSLAGRWVSTLFPAVKFLGLRSIYPELWQKVRRFTSISDWIGFIFTGQLGYEPSQAGETLLYDIAAGTWSEELCHRFDVPPSMLPPIVQSGTLLGPVLREAASQIGIAPGTPFIVGGADTQLAIESCRPAADDIVIVAGTTTPIAYLSDHYIVDPEERCWVDRHVISPLFVVETNVGVSGMNYERAIRAFYPPDSSYAQVEAELAERPLGRCIASAGSMIFHRRKVTQSGGFFVDAPLQEDLSRADIVLAILLDYVFSFKLNYSQLLDVTGAGKGTLYGCGGGFLSGLLPQLMADAIQREIQVPDGFSYASCMGLVNQLNRFFGREAAQAQPVCTVTPGRRGGLDDLYERWQSMRELINP